MLLFRTSGEDPVDIIESTSAQRIGWRIRDIRKSKKMTQVELGERVGLNGARIHKYEAGERKPKLELLKRIASALEVETMALVDPVVTSELGAMYAFFEMEKQHKLEISKVNGKLTLTFGNGYMGGMNGYLREWEKECRHIDAMLEAAATEEERQEVLKEYNMWKWTFPWAIVERTERSLKEVKKAQLEEQIGQLQKELSDLEDE